MKDGWDKSKQEVRQRLRAASSLHSPEECARESQRIVSEIRGQTAWKQCRVLLSFAPISGEPDLRELCHQALRERKTVAFPRYLQETGGYRAFEVLDLQRDLVAGRFGIAEPGTACPECNLNKLDLVFVPALGFSLDGVRLGRGKGYYDRLLAKVSAKKCGVAFDWQIAAELPWESHDVRMDCLVTPSGWHDVTRQA